MIFRENDQGTPCFVMVAKASNFVWYKNKVDLMFHVIDDGLGYYYETDYRTGAKKYINYGDAILLSQEDQE